MGRRRRVRVPASSGNLGPGYDALAAALGLEIQLEVEETGGELVVDGGGIPGVPEDASNLSVRAFQALHPAEGHRFRVSGPVPVGAGLGSSAAAIAAGLVAADHMYELALSPQDLLDHGAALEGHPEQVAASLRGGFVICADGQATRFDPPAGLEAVLVIPATPVSTREARAALPAELPVGEAVFSVAHASLLVLGLARGDWDLVARGLADRFHQPRRASLYPRSMELVERAPELGAIGASISGAGPTVLFWVLWEQTGALVERLRSEVGDWAEVRRTQFAPHGAEVVEL